MSRAPELIPPALQRQKRVMDVMMFLLCPAIIGGGLVVAMLEQSGDLARLYAWNALVVELLLCYIPAILFMERQGGKKRFGLVRIGALEWVFSILLGVAVFFLFNACDMLLSPLLSALGLPEVEQATSIPGGWRFFACVFLIGIVPAISEATLFQGALLYAWLPHGKNRALWHSAMLFALVQMQPSIFPIMLLVGLLFAHVSIAAGSCFPAIAMYAVNNILSVAASYVFSAGVIEVLPISAVGLLGIGLLLGLAAYFGLMRASGRRRAAVMEAASKLYKAVRDAITQGIHLEQGEQAERPAVILRTQRAKERPPASGNPQRPDDRLMLLPIGWMVTLTYAFLLSLNMLLLIVLFQI